MEELRAIGGVVGEAAIDEGAVRAAETNEVVVGVEEGQKEGVESGRRKVADVTGEID